MRGQIERERIVNPVIMWILIVSGVFVSFVLYGSKRLFEQNILSWIALAFAIVYWSYFFIGAISVNRHIAVSAASVKRIVRVGVYSKVRHPIYSSEIVLAWGIFLFWPAQGMLSSAIWITLIALLWAKLEESALKARFKELYVDYKKNTPMLIPDFSIDKD
jgi:protein-S-isoprenylcysteine O-methyltransferase Ste14